MREPFYDVFNDGLSYQGYGAAFDLLGVRVDAVGVADEVNVGALRAIFTAEAYAVPFIVEALEFINHFAGTVVDVAFEFDDANAYGFEGLIKGFFRCESVRNPKGFAFERYHGGGVGFATVRAASFEFYDNRVFILRISVVEYFAVAASAIGGAPGAAGAVETGVVELDGHVVEISNARRSHDARDKRINL